MRFAAASKLSPVCDGDTLDIVQLAFTEFDKLLHSLTHAYKLSIVVRDI